MGAVTSRRTLIGLSLDAIMSTASALEVSK